MPRDAFASPRRRLLALPVMALLCLLMVVGAATTAAGGGLLDGGVFVGPTGAEGRNMNHEDRVVFRDGRFVSEVCARWGFGEGRYQAWRDGDTIRFRAVTESRTRGRLDWEGTLHRGRLEATFVWTKERLLWTTRRGYWFRGLRAAEADVSVTVE